MSKVRKPLREKEKRSVVEIKDHVWGIGDFEGLLLLSRLRT